MKHYGEYDREAVVLLGYNKPSGRMLLIPLPQLNELQQQFLAGVIRKHLFVDESLIPILQRETYQGMDAFSHFSSFAIQVPLHFVKMADRAQTEAWTGSSAQFSERVIVHPFMKLVQGERPTTAAPVVPAYNEPESPVAAAMQPAPTAAAPANDDLAAIRHMMASMMERLAQVEQNQLAQTIPPAYPNLGPFAAQTTDASGQVPASTTTSEA